LFESIVINTANAQRTLFQPASDNLVSCLQALRQYDTTAARFLNDGTLTTPHPTALETAFGLVRVGTIALSMASRVFMIRSFTAADAVAAAAEILILVPPGQDPNTCQSVRLSVYPYRSVD
jgi:hypothetical protein